MKNSKNLIILGSAAAAVILGLVLVFSVVGTLNDYSRITNKVKAVQQDNANVLDNTRKKIREAASVSDKEVEALTNIIVGYADARGQNTAGDGQMLTLSLVREAVPSINSIETLRNLQNIIVAGRTDWQNAQTRLIDLKRQADDLYTVEPSGSILKMFGREELEITVVTSAETKDNFRTGEDNESWTQ